MCEEQHHLVTGGVATKESDRDALLDERQGFDL